MRLTWAKINLTGKKEEHTRKTVPGMDGWVIRAEYYALAEWKSAPVADNKYLPAILFNFNIKVNSKVVPAYIMLILACINRHWLYTNSNPLNVRPALFRFFGI